MNVNLRTPGMKAVLVGAIGVGMSMTAHVTTSRAVNVGGEIHSMVRDYAVLPCAVVGVLAALVALILAARGRAKASAGLAVLVLALGGLRVWQGLGAYVDDDPPGFDAAYDRATHRGS
jgi:hypothetical protein